MKEQIKSKKNLSLPKTTSSANTGHITKGLGKGLGALLSSDGIPENN